jgi:YggT family protein
MISLISLIPFVAQVINQVINILIYAIIIRAFLSFIPQIRSNQLIRLLNDITDPLLKPFQRFQIGGPGMAMDFSPLIAIIILSLIQSWIVRPFF